MRRRIAILLVLVLISGLAILGYFIQQGRETLLTDPYKAISPSASVVIETIDLQSFLNSLTTGKGLFGEARKIKEFKDFNLKLKYLADQINKPGYKKMLYGGISLISFIITGSGRIQTLLSATASPGVKSRQIREALQSSGISSINERKINGNLVLELPFKTGNIKDTVFVSLISGLIVCTSSGRLLNETIVQINRNTDIRNIPGFSRLLQASGKNEDKIFVIFKNLLPYFKSVFKPEFAEIAQKSANLAGCAGGDIYLSDNGLALSGYMESLDAAEVLNKYKSVIPVQFSTYKILPSSTVLFESRIIQKAPVHPGAEGSEGHVLAGRLREYMSEEVTRAYISLKDRPLIDNSLIIYRLINRPYAEKIFLDESAAYLNKDNIIFFQPDEQINIPVYKTPFKGFASEFLPDTGGDSDDSWFTFYDNYLITGSSYATLSRVLYDNLLNKTLANDLVYRNFESTLPSIASYYLYFTPSRLIDYLSVYLKDDIIKSLRANISSLDKVKAAGYQFVSSNKMIYNTLSISFKDEARMESTTEWETLLDTVAATKPFFFTNHTTGAREIFVQDLRNNVYLINAAGRILWKVPLRERVIGNVYMIDYYRNSKYQLLFSGKDFLHLLDRNGNYVERYPVKLRSPSTNGLALFDYDNIRDYRLLIAGEDKIIYAYDKSGNTVKGWKPFKTNGVVSSEIYWFRVSGKDYLIVSDETSVYFIDRTGSARLTLKEPVTKARRSPVRLISGSSPTLVCTAPDGAIQQISFDGSVEKFSLRKFSFDHSFDIFDINGDGFGEYIFIDRGILYLYGHDRSEIFKRDFGSDGLGGPINFVFSASDRKIGVFDGNKKLIYLIDRNGETMKGFPLRGASMFSIGKLSDKSGWHLIVGGTDRFLYNYKLDTQIN